MAESLDSRKFERKTVFDVPLPIRRVQKEAPIISEDVNESGDRESSNTMAFSLMTKKGNKQQVCADPLCLP